MHPPIECSSDVHRVNGINRDILTHEAEILHRQFFQRNASPRFIEDYVKAHKELPALARANDNELRTMRTVINRRLDALGIEPWLRHGPKRHLLSRKLLLIAYLAECDAAHTELRREVVGRTHGLARLGWCGILATIRLVRGRLQRDFYGLL